jgi:hypothetical protein
MNYSRLALAALGGTVAHFAFGFLVFWLAPALINEARKYPAVFRPREEIQPVSADRIPQGSATTGICCGLRFWLYCFHFPSASKGSMQK